MARSLTPLNTIKNSRPKHTFVLGRDMDYTYFMTFSLHIFSKVTGQMAKVLIKRLKLISNLNNNEAYSQNEARLLYGLLQ